MMMIKAYPLMSGVDEPVTGPALLDITAPVASAKLPDVTVTVDEDAEESDDEDVMALNWSVVLDTLCGEKVGNTEVYVNVLELDSSTLDDDEIGLSVDEADNVDEGEAVEVPDALFDEPLLLGAGALELILSSTR